ncbi:MAG: hypothetical protein CVU22_09785 [Betaproteobacteria bacterium HGW-Betaproteobacteria-16]|nr:MAG: hypothetical protein CVU22_09785 [Betaproteobacteria bacterium HGW-Betaproteobacteria-16]
MQKQPVLASTDAYVQCIFGWQRPRVEALRALALVTPGLEERLKWGHLVYLSTGGDGQCPVLLIRAEATRLLFGFWRDQRLRHIEPRLKPGGKYEMATLVLFEDTPLKREVAQALLSEAVQQSLPQGDAARP